MITNNRRSKQTTEPAPALTYNVNEKREEKQANKYIYAYAYTWKWWNYSFAVFSWHFTKNEKKKQRNNINGCSDGDCNVNTWYTQQYLKVMERKNPFALSLFRSVRVIHSKGSAQYAFIYIQFEWENELRESINRSVSIFYFVWSDRVASEATKPKNTIHFSCCSCSCYGFVLVYLQIVCSFQICIWK